MTESRATAAAVLAAGVLIAAAAYAGLHEIALSQRYVPLDLQNATATRMNSLTGAIEFCGPAAVGGIAAMKGVPDGSLELLRLNAYRNPSMKHAFDEKYGAGAADKALEGTRRGLACATTDSWH